MIIVPARVCVGIFFCEINPHGRGEKIRINFIKRGIWFLGGECTGVSTTNSRRVLVFYVIGLSAKYSLTVFLEVSSLSL